MNQAHTISQQLDYLGMRGPKDKGLHVIHYDQQPILRQQSPPISIDFYFLSIKAYPDGPRTADGSLEYAIYLDTPHRKLAWDTCETPPLSGYGILINAVLLAPYIKQYSFAGYSSHEALFLTPEERTVMMDLFQKAYAEYNKPQVVRPVLIAYAALILSYTQLFYERQFQSRAPLYHRVVADFYGQLEQYFAEESGVHELPTVAYFAQKASLSTNYFADLIKLFTGQPPQAHIHQQVIQLAKARLRQSDATVNEIAYALGFEYPAYFTRLFKKETGITPTVFRHQ